MQYLYNTVLGTYVGNFEALRLRSRFHLASRLYLWNQFPQAQVWLQDLRPDYFPENDPALTLMQLAAEPVPPLGNTASVRQPHFQKFPDLRRYERCLFRLLFLRSLYGASPGDVFFSVFDRGEVLNTREQLLSDEEALRTLSSFGINFLYLLDRLALQDETSLPIEYLFEVGLTKSNTSHNLSHQLQCYYLTHCIIGETLFYYRRIPTAKQLIYARMFADAEKIVSANYDALKLDTKLELLVCARLLKTESTLQERILAEVAQALNAQNFIGEPRKKQLDTLSSAEHRNVLFLMASQPFQPLNSSDVRAVRASRQRKSAPQQQLEL